VSFDRQNLQPFGPEIWIADGPVASLYGFPYSTRMAVISDIATKCRLTFAPRDQKPDFSEARRG
jgi:hypothetical protein